MGHVLLTDLFFGDSGKAKIIEEELNANEENYGVVATFQGGDNAGGTQWVKVPAPDTFKGGYLGMLTSLRANKDEVKEENGQWFVKKVLHHIPGGITYKNMRNLQGQGSISNPRRQAKELEGLAYFLTEDNLKISDHAQVNLDVYSLIESILTKKAVGTTNKAIGPTYGLKYFRFGVTFGDFVDRHGNMDVEPAQKKIRYSLEKMINPLIRAHTNLPPTTVTKVLDSAVPFIESFRHRIVNSEQYLREVIEVEGRHMLANSRNGHRINIHVGEYPNLTCSDTGIGGAYSGLGYNVKFDRIIGIVKAPFASKVGGGVFPTEFCNPELFANFKKGDEVITPDLIQAALEGDGQAMSTYARVKGMEYGATTGRPRRMGWLDANMLRQGVLWTLATEIAATKFDAGDDWEGDLKICTEYELDSEAIKYIPNRPGDLADCKAVYGRKIPGWASQGKVRGSRSLEDMPKNSLLYAEAIQDELGIPVKTISTSERSGDIIRNAVLENYL